MKKITEKIVDYFRTLIKTMYLIWKCSHRLTIMFIFSNVILGVCSPILMVVWKYFLDAVTKSISTGNQTEIRKSITLLIIHCFIIILMDFTNQLAGYFQEMQKDYLNKYILNLTMEKISQLDMVHFDDPEIYDKIEKVNNESTQRTVSLLSLMVIFVRTITTLIGTIFILKGISIVFVLCCFLACIPMFVVSTKVSVKKYALFSNRMEKMRLVYALKHLVSKYENVKEIKIFRLGDYIKSVTNNIYEKNLKEDIIIRRKYLRNISFSNIVQNIISYSFKFYVLMEVLIGNAFTIGDLTMFISAIESFQSASQSLLQTVSDLYIDGLYLKNLFSLLNINVKVEGNAQFDMHFKEIVFDDVWFKYPGADEYVLKGINCSFQAGQSYCIVGLNGSGKTTLVKLLTKLYEPTKGKILIDGMDLRKINSESYYQSIGVIFQDFIKYPFNVMQNIGVGNIEELDDFNQIKLAAEMSGADKFIEELPNSYETILQKEWSDGTELSLGQWQKIAISRAYMSNSSIIILDEPTASLDAEAEYDVYRQFENLMQDKMCVLISHRLSVNRLVEKVYFLSDGVIIEEGTHSELMKKNGTYKAYFNKQASSYWNGEIK